jgi:hypothetical protein
VDDGVFGPRRARQREEGPACLDKLVQDTVNNVLEGRMSRPREGGCPKRRDHIAPLQACLPDPAIIGSWRSWSRSLRSS